MIGSDQSNYLQPRAPGQAGRAAFRTPLSQRSESALRSQRSKSARVRKQMADNLRRRRQGVRFDDDDEDYDAVKQGSDDDEDVEAKGSVPSAASDAASPSGTDVEMAATSPSAAADARAERD